MHGIIFAELQKYAETKHGRGRWNQLLTKAGLENKVYLPIKEYPDTEVVRLVEAASSMLGLPVAEVPTTWKDRTAGESHFQMWKWLPHYLHWYRLGMLGRLRRR